jgi:F0F1-type ATP synthase assembly protein I
MWLCGPRLYRVFFVFALLFTTPCLVFVSALIYTIHEPRNATLGALGGCLSSSLSHFHLSWFVFYQSMHSTAWDAITLGPCLSIMVYLMYVSLVSFLDYTGLESFLIATATA